MKPSAKLYIKISDFWKKNKKIIIVILIVWALIFIINRFLGNTEKVETPTTTYTPHTAVINSNESVPQELQSPIENIIQEYFNYCNNGEFQNAYNMLSEECKKNKFKTLASFEDYAKKVFEDGGKIYNIQTYSILEDTYIYNIRILDDILANGTTGGYGYYEEKLVIKGDSEKNLTLSIGDYVSNQNLNIFGEDDYLRIEILNKTINYDSEIYTVKITNKSEYSIVLANGAEDLEIGLYIGDQTRKVNLVMADIVLQPNTSTTRNLEFTKFADDGRNSSMLIFNAIRVLQSYSGNESTYQSELESAIKLYSLNINL